MATRGPTQVVEGIWRKISNDIRVRDALNTTRNLLSNKPFIGIVVGTGEESKHVAFAIVPVFGGAHGGLVQAIDEAVSGRPISISTVLSALQSLGAISVPGLVVGTVVSGAVNAVNLFANGENNQVPSTPALDTEATATISIKPVVLQVGSLVDAQKAIRDKGAEEVSKDPKIDNCVETPTVESKEEDSMEEGGN
ncbi:hypothetical protein OPQ81_002287 [Rhizoctonia solani]|nr:hypothetical protein OPQ81_002287 [Rhizoctonia solani]